MMEKLIENLLFLAHADENRQGIPKQALSLSDLVSEMTLAFEKGQTLDSHIKLGLQVQGDPDLLRQLLGILLNNAVEYTPEGGSIEVELKINRDKSQLTIQNTLAYIEKEHLSHLFDRFYRQDSAY